MLDLYAFEDTHKLERKALERRLDLLLRLLERRPRYGSRSGSVGPRRRLAQALLVLADRLDPRGVVSVPHTPARPALNGTLHHA